MREISKKIRFNWLFLLLIIGILLFDNFKNFIIYFLVVGLHELAHFIVAKKLGYKLNKFYIMPYGVCLNYENIVFQGNDEFLIALAGPLFNYLLCVICLAIWWLFPITYYYLDYFCFCNLLLATFNILPCFPLDGGRVAVCLLSKITDREKAIKITIIFNYALSLILIILFIISLFKSINYSYMFIAIFLFSGCINPKKYSQYEYLSLKINKYKIYNKGCSVKIMAFSSNVSLYKIMAKFTHYKYNIVYIIMPNGAVKVLSENNINNLALKYSPALSLDEIIALSCY